MSLNDYLTSQVISRQDHPFCALIMAAMRQADTRNGRALREAFPDIWAELDARYSAPGGLLPGEHDMASRVFTAAYPGECAECGDYFDEGDEIRYSDDGEVVAQDCCGYAYDPEET